MFQSFKPVGNNDFCKIAEKQLEKNVHIIISLRDYSAGKKDISTRVAEEYFPELKITS